MSVDKANLEPPDNERPEGEVSEQIARVNGELEVVRFQLQQVREQAEAHANRVSLEMQSKEKRVQEVKEQLARLVEGLGMVEKQCQQKKEQVEVIEKESRKLERGKGMWTRRRGKLRRSRYKRHGRKVVSGGKLVSLKREDHRVYGQERADGRMNEGMDLSRRHAGEKTEMKDTRNNTGWKAQQGLSSVGQNWRLKV